MFKSLILPLIALAILGCTPPQVVYQPMEIDIIGQQLKSDIKILNLNSRINRDLLEVYFVAENDTNFKKELLYKIDWFDGSGFAIDTILSRYKKLIANPKERFTIQEIAPNPNASQYRITIKE
jgi:uncharacterized protein YcfL